MKLKGQQPILAMVFRVVVDDLGGLHPVDGVYEVVALGDNTILVPLAFLDGLADFLGVTELLA